MSCYVHIASLDELHTGLYSCCLGSYVLVYIRGARNTK